MTHFFKKETVLASLLIILILSLSYFPLFYHLKTCPPGKVFSLSTGFPPDFLGNLTIVQEGYLGDFLRTSKVSSTIPSPPLFNRMEYVLIGHFARILKFRPEVFFHFVRFFLSLSLLLTTYYLLFIVFPKSWQRLAAFILILFSTQIDLNFLPFLHYKILINYWSPLHFNHRFSYYPHYLLAFLFLLWAVIFLAKSLEQRRPSFLIAATFFGLLSSFIHPPPILLFYLSLPFYFLLKLWRAYHPERRREIPGSSRLKPQPQNDTHWLIFCLLIFISISCLPLIYLKSISKVFPFTLLSLTEKQNSLPLSPLEIILGIGPTFFLSLLGMKPPPARRLRVSLLGSASFLPASAPPGGGDLYKARNKKGRPVSNDLLLLILPTPLVLLLGFFLIAPLLGFANIRFLQTPFFIFLGILSIFGAQALKKSREKKFVFLATLLALLLSTNGLIFAFRESLKAFRDSPFFCIKKEVMDGVDWFEKNTNQKEIILSFYEPGTLIAAYSGNKVFVTSFVGALPNLAEFDLSINNFFKEKLTKKEAAAFLEREKISYVFFGPEEKELAGKESLSYPFLKLVFENKEIKIYKVFTSF